MQDFQSIRWLNLLELIKRIFTTWLWNSSSYLGNGKPIWCIFINVLLVFDKYVNILAPSYDIELLIYHSEMNKT